MRKQQNNNGSGSSVKNLRVLILAGFFIIIIFVSIFEVESKPLPFRWLWKSRVWTGFGENVDKNSFTVTETTNGKTIVKTTTIDKHEPEKRLWDWMSLLLAPAMLAVLGFWFQIWLEKAKKEQAEQAQNRAADQQREEALQNYLNRLSKLLVDKQLKKLLPSQMVKSEGEAATSATVNLSIDAEAALEVIKARTLSLLRLFDQDIPRKASVLSFLGDADLLKELDLDLSRSNFKNANLRRVNLSDAHLHLSFADLSFADLSGAKLSGADLSGANLCGANLCLADLSGANLSGANLSGANLSDAKLSDEKLSDEKLSDANLQKAKYTDDSTSQDTCKHYFLEYRCHTKFPPNFDPKAAGMELLK